MKFKSHLDKIVWRIIAVLSVFICGMLISGDFTQPQVQYFNGTTGFISPQTSQFLFRFNRLMDRKSVEEGFKISPQVEGRFSWSGRTFAFTAKEPLAYDQHYTIVFEQAKDLAGKLLVNNIFQAEMSPQRILFLTETGAIRQLNILNQAEQQISPENLFVQQFQVSPLGDFVSILAAKQGVNLQNRNEFKLYVLDLKSAQIMLIPTDTNVMLDHLQWLPDGSGIGFSMVNSSTNKEGIYVYDLALKTIVNIAPQKALAYSFYFTPDSSKVVYVDTNGAVILGDMPSGQGALVATTFMDVAGFDTAGEILAYIAPVSIDAFDLSNVPVLLNAAGDEEKIAVAEDSTSFDLHFVPQQKKLVFTLETALGTMRKDAIMQYDYEKKVLSTVVTGEHCAALRPQVSTDAKWLVWQCVNNDNKGYTLTGWNDYQGRVVTADVWLKNLLTGEEKSLNIQGADTQFIP